MTRGRTHTLGMAVDYTKQVRPAGAPPALTPEKATQTKRILTFIVGQAIKKAGLTPEQVAEYTTIPLTALRDVLGGHAQLADEPLARVLRLCGVPNDQIGKARRELAAVLHARPEILTWAPTAGPLPETMLTITSSADLAEVLKHVVENSGMQKKYVARQAGLSRSQLYNLIDPARDSLPRKPGQIRALLETCAVPADHVTRVLEQWHVLNLDRHHPEPNVAEPDAAASAHRTHESQETDPRAGAERAVHAPGGLAADRGRLWAGMLLPAVLIMVATWTLPYVATVPAPVAVAAQVISVVMMAAAYVSYRRRWSG